MPVLSPVECTCMWSLVYILVHCLMVWITALMHMQTVGTMVSIFAFISTLISYLCITKKYSVSLTKKLFI